MAYQPTTSSWKKITKTYSDFSAAAVTKAIDIYTLQSKEVLEGVFMNATTKFSGGLIATYTISVGIAGNLTKFAANTSVFTGAALPSIAMNPSVESVSGTTTVQANAISTVGNLNAATAGSIDIYILTSMLP